MGQASPLSFATQDQQTTFGRKRFVTVSKLLPRIISLNSYGGNMKKQFFIWSMALSLVTFLLPHTSAQHSSAHNSFTVEMKNTQGESVGTATLTQIGRGVRIKLNLKNLPPGPHAIHFHQMAKCEGPTLNPPEIISIPPPSNTGLKTQWGLMLVT